MPRGGKRQGAGRKPGINSKPTAPTAEEILKALKTPKGLDKLLNTRLARYNLKKADYEAMLAEQKGLCALCEAPLTTPWHVDHDHLTGRVRGLLHANCNSLLGMGHEDPRRFEQAIAYIKRHNKFLA